MEIVKYFLKKSAEVNACNSDNEKSLIYASFKGHFEIVKYLVENRADVNFDGKKDKKG